VPPSVHTARRAGKKRKPSWVRRPSALAERVEQAHALDPVVRRLSDGVVRALPAGPRTDALHGVPFGQPAHPALVRLPLGCWTSAVLLDLFRGTDRAARMLIGAGVAATVPAAATGLADWSALHRDQQRVGLVHAACQAGAAALFLGSLTVRARGRPRYGRVLSGGGLFMATAGSYLGGHLALRLGAGASHAEPVSHLSGLGWHDLCELDELPDRRPVRRQLGYLSLLVYRQGGEVNVLSDRCSHLGGPLHQGRIVVERGTACVACPWHGSTFAIADGTVVHGPATARQPAFETRVTPAGRVELRARP
jgi:nitrite reductase/ring-hydroxylating ferredoxin subunit/uncharacterized membrane protein